MIIQVYMVIQIIRKTYPFKKVLKMQILRKKMCTKLINLYIIYKKTLNTTKCLRYHYTLTVIKKGKKALWTYFAKKFN